jgi:hypothetical protein
VARQSRRREKDDNNDDDEAANRAIKAMMGDFADFAKRSLAPGAFQSFSEIYSSQIESSIEGILKIAEDSHFLQKLSPELQEYHRRMQVQTLLFNLGILLSFVSVPTGLHTSEQLENIKSLNEEVVENCRQEGVRAWLRPFPITYAMVFIKKFFGNIKAQICKPDDKVVKFTAGASVTTLSAWLLQEFGMLHPVAIGISAAIILIVGRAAKETFCSLNENDFLGRITANPTSGNLTK